MLRFFRHLLDRIQRLLDGLTGRRRHYQRRRHRSTSTRIPDFPRHYTLVRQGRSISQLISSRDELVNLRSELEMLRLCGEGDSTQALAALAGLDEPESAEIRDILIDARHPVTEAAIRQIDDDFPGVSSEINVDVLHAESRAFRHDVVERLRDISVALAGQYADSASLDETSPSPDEPARESAMTKKAKKSAPKAEPADEMPAGDDAVDATLDAIDSDLADLTRLADEQEAQATNATDTAVEAADPADAQDADSAEALAAAVLAEATESDAEPDAEAAAPTNVPAEKHAAENTEPEQTVATSQESLADQGQPTAAPAAHSETSPTMHHDDQPAAQPATIDQPTAESPRPTASSHPEPQNRSAPRTTTRSAARSPRQGAVENAIENLGHFLLEEVNGLWTEAREALEQILVDRDHIREVRNSISALHDEMLSMCKDAAAARRDAALVQSQIHNIRDDATRARQRADNAATDAQSACDRAVAAAREADVVAAHGKSLT